MMTQEAAFGKVVLCLLGEELYGLALDEVVEIVRLSSITLVPGTHEAVEGIMNWHGSLVFVINGHKLNGHKASSNPAESQVVILQIHDRMLGYMVDTIKGVDSIQHEDMYANIMSSQSLLKGIAKLRDGHLVRILDTVKLISLLSEEPLATIPFTHEELKPVQSSGFNEESLEPAERLRYLKVGLGGQYWGIPIHHIQSISYMPDRLEALHGAPPYFLGYGVIREQIVPFIDLALLLHVQGKAYPSRVVLMDIQIKGQGFTIALAVEQTQDVMALFVDEIVDLPEYVAQHESITGMHHLNKADSRENVILLQGDKLLPLEQLQQLASSQSQAKFDAGKREEEGWEKQSLLKMLFLIFELDLQLIAIPVSCMKEIMRPNAIMEVPLADASMAGLTNIRGQLVTILHLSHILGLSRKENGNLERMIITEYEDTISGFTVDAVLGVRELQMDELEPISSLEKLSIPDHHYYQGLVKFDSDRMIFILNPEEVYSHL
jgi:purine-binding chemotaxis protein CheW